MDTTTFAVVIANHDYLPYVGEAVESALAQTRAAAQVIVIDDGSRDGSAQLLQDRYAADPRVTLVCTANGGQLAAFQRAMPLVDADVVCFLDADDLWEREYLDRLGATYDARADVDVVFSDLDLFGQENRRVAFAQHPVDLGYTAVATYALGTWYGAPTSALSMRAAWARRALDLPADAVARWRLSADNCLVYGTSVLGARKVYLPTGQVRYRIHGSNGWWSRRSPTASYHNRLQSRALIAHYAARAGIDRSSLALAKLEFLTGQAPWREARRYARVALRSDAGWLRRIEHAGVILLRGLVGRRA